MANASNIVLRGDDAVDYTLVPVASYSDNQAKLTVVYRELNPNKPLMACIKLTLEQETLKSGVIKVSRKLEMPVMKIIPANAVNANGQVAAPEVSHVETDVRTRYHHPQSTPTERAQSLKMACHADAGAGATIGAANITSTTVNAWRDMPNTSPIPYGDINFVWPSA